MRRRRGTAGSTLLPAALAILLAGAPTLTAQTAASRGSTAPPPTTPFAGPVRSPTVADLARAAARADTLHTGDFWKGIAERGTPLFEAVPGSDSTLVTFLWRGSPGLRNAVVLSALSGWLAPRNLMDRVPGTDVWFLSLATRPDVRFTYRISPDDNLRIYWEDPDFAERARGFRADPWNPDTVPFAGQSASAAVGPGAPPGPWDAPREPGSGLRDSLDLGSRVVRLYLPPEAERADEVGVVVALDGPAYDALVSTPAIVEALVAGGRIPPTAVALVPNPDRTTTLPPNEPFLRMIADTLLPALEDRLPLSRDPARSAIVGSSLGGLAAAWLGYRLPDRFGNVVAQSGAWWWTPPGGDEGGWLQRLYATGPRRDLRVYLDAGILEAQPVRGGVSMIRLTQHMRDVLCARGYEVAYTTFPGGHEYGHWRRTLPAALAWALGGARQEGLEGCRPPEPPRAGAGR